MERTHQMIQMMMIANLGADNFERAKKIMEGVDTQEDQEDIEEKEDIILLSNAEECEKREYE